MRAFSYACMVTSDHVTKTAVTPFDPLHAARKLHGYVCVIEAELL